MMKSYKRRNGILKLVACLSLTIFLGGCKGEETSSSNTNQTFDEFTEEVFEEMVSTDTLSLHFSLAYPEKYDIGLDEVTFGDFEVEFDNTDWEIYEQWESQLTSYEKESLTRQQQITYDVFQFYLDSCLESKDMYYYYEPLIPGTGIHANLPYLLAEYSFYKEQDIEDYLNLFPLMDGYFQKIVEWEKKRAEEELFMSDGLLKQVISECDTYIFTGEIDETNFIYETFSARLDQVEGLTEEKKKGYKDRQIDLLKNDFSQAYLNLKNQMENMYGLGVNEEGLAHFPKGKEYYAYMIKESIGMTYKSVDALFSAIKKNINLNFKDFYYILDNNEDVLNQLSTIQDDTRTPQEILTDLRDKIKEDFPPLPDHSYGIKGVASSMEEFMNPAFYLNPAIDKYDDNVIYINYGNMEGTSLYSVLAHEGYPGHLYQNVYYLSKDNSNLRHTLSFLGYSEGWATYVQMYTREWDGALDGDLAKLTYIEEIINMAFSAYLDIGINYYGWTLEETIEESEVILGNMNEDAFADMYQSLTGDPGVYLNYYVGFMEINKLKSEAKEKLGDKFNDMNFHTFLLDIGPAPFTVIKTYFDEWLKEQ